MQYKAHCTLPRLPKGRYGHTSVGGVLCGGRGRSDFTKTSCISLDPIRKKWTETKYQPIRQRVGHVSWNWTNFEFENSFVLLGGSIYSGNNLNSDVVFNDGKVVPGEEDLKYPIQ